MAHANEEVVRAYIAALAEGDMDRVGEFLSDDVVFHMGGRNPMSGDKRGRDESIGMLRMASERAGGRLAVDVHDVLANDEHVVALVRRKIAGIDTTAAIVYHVGDGRITEVWIHEGDQQALDEALAG